MSSCDSKASLAAEKCRLLQYASLKILESFESSLSSTPSSITICLCYRPSMNEKTIYSIALSYAVGWILDYHFANQNCCSCHGSRSCSTEVACPSDWGICLRLWQTRVSTVLVRPSCLRELHTTDGLCHWGFSIQSRVHIDYSCRLCLLECMSGISCV